MPIPTSAGPDTVCQCGHWFEEHGPDATDCAGCDAADLDFPSCEAFVFDPEENTPAAIADRGGDPDKWPEWVKEAE